MELSPALWEWLNSVDTTYRSDLRELNSANRAHIDARFEAFEGRLEAKLARLEGGLLARIGQAEGRLARLTLTFTLACWLTTLGTIVALLKL